VRPSWPPFQRARRPRSQGGERLRYANVLSTYPNSQSNTAINVWDAILTGSDISTVQSATASNNGYMQVANPTISAFSPPAQLVDNTGTNPPIGGVNTTFNLSTGMLSLASYSLVNASGISPAPTGAPNLSLVIGTAPMANQGIQFQLPNYTASNNPGWGFYSYNTSTGILTANGYLGYSNQTPSWAGENFANGQQTLNMASCAVNSDAVLTLNANPNNGNQYGASGTLSCSTTVPIAASSAIPATTPTLSTVNTAMPTGSSGSAPTFYAPNSTYVSTQNSNLWSYSATGSLTSTTAVNSDGSVSAPTIAAATSNVTAVTTSTASTTNGATATTTTTVPPGYLMVTGYGYSTSNSTQTTPFANGVQTLDMTSCATNAATLTVYPYSATAGAPTGSQAYGYLTCQSPPTLPYNACTKTSKPRVA